VVTYHGIQVRVVDRVAGMYLIECHGRLSVVYPKDLVFTKEVKAA
jgi:hypothetical protein